MSRPAIPIFYVANGTVNPSKMGTAVVTPSPESNISPVVRPEAYREHTSYELTYRQGILNNSNMILVVVSLFCLGFKLASVKMTGCSSGETFSSLMRV